jgi:hypothetical protein
VTVLELFALAFFSAASTRGQWKSPFPISTSGYSRTASENIIFTSGFFKKPPMKIAFPLVVFLFSRQWKFFRLFF